MNEWMERCTDLSVADGQTWTDGWIDRWIDKRLMDRRMDRWTNGCSAFLWLLYPRVQYTGVELNYPCSPPSF